MALATAIRLVLGILIVAGGALKIKRVGKAVLPEAHEQVVKGFSKFHKVFPLKDVIKITSAQYREICGYIEMVCGFLLLTGQLLSPACSILIAVFGLATYSMYLLKYPMPQIFLPVGMILGLLIVCRQSQAKPKQD